MSRFDFSTPFARKGDSEFVLAAARAFYVDHWLSDERNERKVPSGCDILDYAPRTQRWALNLARHFVAALESKFGKPLDSLIDEWRAVWEEYEYSDRDSSDENIGWYAAMESMGHGSGLGDFGIDVDLPHFEAYPR